jgi:hypothetical protein
MGKKAQPPRVYFFNKIYNYTDLDNKCNYSPILGFKGGKCEDKRIESGQVIPPTVCNIWAHPT